MRKTSGHGKRLIAEIDRVIPAQTGVTYDRCALSGLTLACLSLPPPFAPRNPVVCRNSADRSCGLPIVEVEQSSETFSPSNSRSQAGRRWRSLCPVSRCRPPASRSRDAQLVARLALRASGGAGVCLTRFQSGRAPRSISGSEKHGARAANSRCEGTVIRPDKHRVNREGDGGKYTLGERHATYSPL